MLDAAMPLTGCQGAVAKLRQPLLALKRLGTQAIVEHMAPDLSSAAVPRRMIHVPWRIFEGITQDRNLY